MYKANTSKVHELKSENPQFKEALAEQIQKNCMLKKLEWRRIKFKK